MPLEAATPKWPAAKTKATIAGAQMAWVLELQASAVVSHMPEIQLYQHTLPDTVVATFYYYELLTAQHMRVIRIGRTSVLYNFRTCHDLRDAWLHPYQEMDILAGHAGSGSQSYHLGRRIGGVPPVQSEPELPSES